MIVLFSSLLLVLITKFMVTAIVKTSDRKLVLRRVYKAWIILFPLLVLTHNIFPFIGGHDDHAYYDWSATSILSVETMFDLSRYQEFAEQPGYLWLLSVVYFFIGQNLLVYKLINLCFFILLIPIWYRIADTIESKEFAKKISTIIIFLSPLWFYGFFVLKDMSIILLQSAFLLGMVLNSEQNKVKYWLLMAGSTLLIIPLRSQLLLINLAVILGVTGIYALKRKQKSRFIAILLSAISILGMLRIATNSDYMSQLGVFSDARVIGSNQFVDSVKGRVEKQNANIIVFSIKYLLSETSGFNIAFYKDFSAYTLRGILAVPWVLLGAPFFILGLYALFKSVDPKKTWITRLFSSPALSPGWSVLLIYLIGYYLLSFVTNDTTRYRMADMPVMATISLAGWITTSPQKRSRMLLLWIFSIIIFYSFYRLLLELI